MAGLSSGLLGLHTDNPWVTTMALYPKQSNITMTEAEYLSFESDSDTKHEFLDGQVLAMTGASSDHIRLTGNVFRKFGNHLEGTPCEAFMSEMKTKVAKDYVYPDVVVVCNHSTKDGYTENPILIVEVLSKSTRKLDLTTKLLKYLNIPSLQEYILIEQDIVSVQVLRRSNGWLSEYFFLGDQVTFTAINLTLSVEAIYDRIENSDVLEYRQKLSNPSAPPADAQ